MWYKNVVSSVLLQYTRLTNRQTDRPIDRHFMAKTGLHRCSVVKILQSEYDVRKEVLEIFN